MSKKSRQWPVASDRKLVVLGGHGGVIAGKVLVEFYGGGQVVHGIPDGQSDVEEIAPMACGLQVDGNGSGLLVERQQVRPDYARTHQHKRSGVVSVDRKSTRL